MNTIEERAKCYKQSSLVEPSVTKYQCLYRGYIRGATEQKQIDEQHLLALQDAHETEKKLWVEKACKTFCDFCPHQCEGFPHDDCEVLIEYKKKMEEEV